MEAPAGPSPPARAALVLGLVGILVPMLGWIVFGLSALFASHDGQFAGAAMAMVLGVVGVLGWSAGIGASIVELVKAGGVRSRLLGWIGLVMALVAPITWAAGWAIAAIWFLESMPGHIL